MASPLFPTFDKRVTDATNRIIQNQVTPWAFLKSGPKFSVMKFDGHEISYSGIPYEGSPQIVFWNGYIDPFLEAMIVEEIDHATSLATQRKVDARILLPEIEGLLISATRKIFDRMSEIDRRLRGNGFPESVPIRTTQVEFNRVQAFISERIQAELSMSKPKPWYEEWLEANKFKTWMIGTGIAVTGLIFTLIKLLST